MHKLYFDKIYFAMHKLYFAFQKLSLNSYLYFYKFYFVMLKLYVAFRKLSLNSYFSFYKLFFVFHKPSPYSNFYYCVRSLHCVVFGALHGSRQIRRAAW